MSSIGTMTARLALDYSDLMKGLRASSSGFSGVSRDAGSAQSHTRRLNQELSRSSGLLAQLGRGPGIAAIALGSAAGGLLARVTSTIAAVPGIALKLAADAEQTQISFEVMLGSADKAKQLLGELKAYADASPFGGMEVNEFAQQLANYNIQAQDIVPTIKQLGDIAAGDANKFRSLATAFGQVVSMGKLQGGEKNQFINAGFNPLKEISRTTGESMPDLAKRMEAGSISVQEVANALKTATTEGGLFFKMTERQAGTLAGKWSTMKDQIGNVLRELGVSLVENLDLKKWVEYVSANIGKIPLLFRNSGILLQSELLEWRIYFEELIPGFNQTMGDIGIMFASGWEAMTNNAHRFFASVKAGLQEIRNLTAVADAANKATANDPRHPSQWARTAMNWLDENASVNQSNGSTADFLFGKQQQQVPVDLKTGKPLSLFQSAARAAGPVLANQKDTMAPGTDWASSFLKDYRKGIEDFVAGPNGGVTNVDMLKQRQADLKEKLLAPSALQGTDVQLGGKLGDSFTGAGAPAKKAKADTAISKADTAISTAAMRGSAEAAKIFTGGSIAQKQLSVLERIEKALAKNKPPITPPMPGNLGVV